MNTFNPFFYCLLPIVVLYLVVKLYTYVSLSSLIYCFGDNYRVLVFFSLIIFWIIYITQKKVQHEIIAFYEFRCNLESSLKKETLTIIYCHFFPLCFLFLTSLVGINIGKLHNFMLKINFHNKQQYFCWIFFFSFLFSSWKGKKKH